MQALKKNLRNELERAIQTAREISEKAAEVTLLYLGVANKDPQSHLSEEDKKLRRELRIHGRQLGDVLQPNGIQGIELLKEEIAYAHWHRMLFARFLAENNLLMYKEVEPPIPITIEECEELAKERGYRNGWELASRYAAEMLPQIFRISSPVYSLEFPMEYRIQLEKLLSDLSVEVFTASDSLGWVYQFWQSKRKDEINASEVKIGGRELPPVTQLFTEPYMVSFLLDNSIGAWWANQCLTEKDLQNAQSEEELRKKASLPGMPLEYLRFWKEGSSYKLPNVYDNWPKTLESFLVLDPCCGSGHFLVAIFHYLLAIRMKLENISLKTAINLVISQNIYGLDIDKVTTQ